MKYLFLCVVALLLCSCNQEIENNNRPYLTLDIDTVIVDAGEEILDLQSYTFTLSPDKKFLYNFNSYDHSLEKINLQELRLDTKIPFEKEGPNGTVNSVYYLNLIDENNIQMADNWTSGQFRLDGTRTINHNLHAPDLKGDVLTEDEYVRNNVIIPEQPWIVYALVTNWKYKTYNLRKMDFKKKEIKKYDIDPKGKIPQYTFKVPSLSKDPIISPTIGLSVEKSKLIISTDLTNEIYLYDPRSDSVITKKNDHKLTLGEKKSDFIGQYASVEELMVDYQKMYEEISFYPPVWDMDNERYYRLSYQIEFKKEKAADSPIPEVAHMYLFFSTYDKNFDLIGEVAVPGSLKTMSKYFVREGMLWLKVNYRR